LNRMQIDRKFSITQAGWCLRFLRHHEDERKLNARAQLFRALHSVL